MSDTSLDPATTAGTSTENASPNVETSTEVNTSEASPSGETAEQTAAVASGAPVPVVGANGQTTYVPNYKYKAALQEKELDPFYRSLVKDAESEKRVKDLFTKVDAFDFVKGKKEEVEKNFNSLLNDYDQASSTIKNFNTSVAKGDLSSAFRTAGITKEQIFKWTQQQLQLMDMPPEQRQQYEQFEQAQLQKSELEQKVTSLEQMYQQQAVQARTVQLEVGLQRPEVSRFAEAWDRNAEQQGAFRNFVAEEARKHFYETKQDLSPEQAIAMVMQKFGRFLNVGDATSQSPQAITQNGSNRTIPVIPNVTGKAASPIKKVPKNLDDLKKLAREASQN